MLMDYRLAGWLGQAWKWLRISSRAKNADMPGLCEAVARGETLPARQLCQVQDFAIDVWLRAAGLPIVTLVTAGVVAKIIYGTAGVPAALVDPVGSVLLLLFGIAAAETILLSYRVRQSRLFLSGSRWASPGGRLPRRSDFWLALALGIGGTGVLLIAGL
jgi:hypothetical protein